MVASWNATTSVSPAARGRKKSARHSRASRRCRGKLNRSRSDPDSDSTMRSFALAHAPEVAVHHGGLQQPLGLRPLQPHPQPRPPLGLHQFLVAGAALLPRRLEPPLPHERRPLVQVRPVLRERHALHHARPEERRLRHRVLRRYIPGTYAADCGIVLLRRFGGAGPGPDPAGAQRRQRGARLASLDGHRGAHQPQALEGVAGVADLALEQRGQVLLDVGPGERRAAEQHRPAGGHAAGVELGQVVPHHHGGLHQQARTSR